MQGFERVVAPFEGVITARNIEQGDLVNDGSNDGAKSLFSIAQSNILRVQVEVPQSDALSIKQGQQASLTVQEIPGLRFIGTVSRSAESVDLGARTMLTEVQVDNHDGTLIPGMYGQVTFDVKATRPSLIIPSTALVIDKNGMHVVSVSEDKRIHIVPVDIGQDLGCGAHLVQLSRTKSGNFSLERALSWDTLQKTADAHALLPSLLSLPEVSRLRRR